MPRQFTHPQMVTCPSINWARSKATTLTKTSSLPPKTAEAQKGISICNDCHYNKLMIIRTITMRRKYWLCFIVTLITDPCDRLQEDLWCWRTERVHVQWLVQCPWYTRQHCVTIHKPPLRSCNPRDLEPVPAYDSPPSFHCPAARGRCHPTHTPDEQASK